MLSLRLRRWTSGRNLRALVFAIGLFFGLASSAAATRITVTPSVVDLTSSTAEAKGQNLVGASRGDRFTLGYTVENLDAAEIFIWGTSILYDPAVLHFVEGFAFPILEQTIPGTPFDRNVGLFPIIAPEPRSGSPIGTLIGLALSPAFVDGLEVVATTAVGPDLAIGVTFEIIDPSAWTLIEMVFLSGDGAQANGAEFCGAPLSSCDDVPGSAEFEFGTFKVGPSKDGGSSTPVPEPTSALLIALGLTGLAGYGNRSRPDA